MNLRVRLRLFTILSLVLFLGLGHSLKAQIETQVLAFPDLVAGGGWGALLTILALGTADRSDGQVRFFGQDAQPLSFNVFTVTSGGTAINGGAPVSTFPYSIPSGESRTFRITADQTKIGWLDLLGAFNPPSLVGRGVVSATLTFRFVQGGRVVSQIGMEATHLLAGATVPFNNLGSNRTGLALLSRIEANSITITAFEEAGNPGPVSFLAPSGDNNIGSVTIDLGRRQQTVRFIDEFLPETAGKRGFVMITGTARFIPLALNQDQVSLVLSTAAVLAEAFELDLTTDPEVDPARFRLRFFRFQRFITVHPVNGEVPPVKGRPRKLPHYANRGKTSSSGGELASARSCFSTVRTALGKLRITGLLAQFDIARSFPQFPRPLLLQPTILTSERGTRFGIRKAPNHVPPPHLPDDPLLPGSGTTLPATWTMS